MRRSTSGLPQMRSARELSLQVRVGIVFVGAVQPLWGCRNELIDADCRYRDRPWQEQPQYRAPGSHGLRPLGFNAVRRDCRSRLLAVLNARHLGHGLGLTGLGVDRPYPTAF